MLSQLAHLSPSSKLHFVIESKVSYNVLTAAFLYLRAGLSVIPIKPDGSKSPAIPSWKEFQYRQPSEAELRAWFNNDLNYGIAILGGTVSSWLEIFDCDAPELFELWCDLVESLCPSLLARLVIVQTPSSGWHVYYRCAEIEGNLKLAQRAIEIPIETKGARPEEDRWVIVKTLLETRGAGGYVLAPPSPPECHLTNRPYILMAGELVNISTITPQERAIMLDAARSFNKYIRPERVYRQSSTRRQLARSNRPGDDYNTKADWHSLLTSHGWKYVFSRGEVSYWRRPGKPAPGISATTNHAGSNLLYVFSSNAYPFQEKAGYSLFSAYSILEHNWDFHAAAKALADQGYGKRTNIILPSRFKPITKPKDTITLNSIERPRDTIQLSTPMRPVATTLLGTEVGQ